MALCGCLEPSNSANCNGLGAMSVPVSVSLCGDSGDGGNP